jgi:hypothetical protein
LFRVVKQLGSCDWCPFHGIEPCNPCCFFTYVDWLHTHWLINQWCHLSYLLPHWHQLFSSCRSYVGFHLPMKFFWVWTFEPLIFPLTISYA